MDHKVNDRLKFAVNMNLSYNDQESALTTSGFYTSPVFGAAMYAPIDAGIIDVGSYLYNGTSGTFASAPVGPNIDHVVTYANANFIANSAYDDMSSRTSRALTDAMAQWSIIDGLVLKSNIGIDYFYLNENAWRDPRPKGNSASYGKGTAQNAFTENFRWNETTTLNYIKNFGMHNLNVLLGQEVQSTDMRSNSATIQDFPGTYFHYADQGATPYRIYGGRSAESLASFFSSVNYNYDDRYLLSASIRNDGSSVLSEDNRWSAFWSVGGSWKMSNENFMKNLKWLNSAMLRVSYGTSGNSSLGTTRRYESMGLYAGGTDALGVNHNYNGSPGTFPYKIANPDLKWEKTSTINIGLDAMFLNGRLGANIDWYKRNTKDLLLNLELSRTSGFENILSNVGEMYNMGIEVAITTIPIRTKDFTWSVDFNISSNKNRITKLYGGNQIINSPYIYREGEDIHSFYLYDYAGVNPADGRPMWYDNDGEITYSISENGNQREIRGSASPDFYGGITTKFQLFGFDLSMLFYFTYGNDILSQSWAMFTSSGQRGWYNQHKSVDSDRWRKEGDITSYPKAYYTYNNANYGSPLGTNSLFDGSYIRLRDVSLGYTLPRKWTDVIKMNSVRIYAQATNLFTITKFPDADPEVGGGRLAGRYYLGYPNAKTITIGLDVKF